MTGRAPSQVCGRCGAMLRWVTTRDNKQMPVNPVADQRGNVAAMRNTAGRYVDAHVIKKDADRQALAAAGYTIFVPHFADCQSEPAKPEPEPNTLF